MWKRYQIFYDGVGSEKNIPSLHHPRYVSFSLIVVRFCMYVPFPVYLYHILFTYTRRTEYSILYSCFFPSAASYTKISGKPTFLSMSCHPIRFHRQRYLFFFKTYRTCFLSVKQSPIETRKATKRRRRLPAVGDGTRAKKMRKAATAAIAAPTSATEKTTEAATAEGGTAAPAERRGAAGRIRTAAARRERGGEAATTTEAATARAAGTGAARTPGTAKADTTTIRWTARTSGTEGPKFFFNWLSFLREFLSLF